MSGVPMSVYVSPSSRFGERRTPTKQASGSGMFPTGYSFAKTSPIAGNDRIRQVVESQKQKVEDVYSPQKENFANWSSGLGRSPVGLSDRAPLRQSISSAGRYNTGDTYESDATEETPLSTDVTSATGSSLMTGDTSSVDADQSKPRSPYAWHDSDDVSEASGMLPPVPPVATGLGDMFSVTASETVEDAGEEEDEEEDGKPYDDDVEPLRPEPLEFSEDDEDATPRKVDLSDSDRERYFTPSKSVGRRTPASVSRRTPFMARLLPPSVETVSVDSVLSVSDVPAVRGPSVTRTGGFKYVQSSSLTSDDFSEDTGALEFMGEHGGFPEGGYSYYEEELSELAHAAVAQHRLERAEDIMAFRARMAKIAGLTSSGDAEEDGGEPEQETETDTIETFGDAYGLGGYEASSEAATATASSPPTSPPRRTALVQGRPTSSYSPPPVAVYASPSSSRTGTTVQSSPSNTSNGASEKENMPPKESRRSPFPGRMAEFAAATVRSSPVPEQSTGPTWYPHSSAVSAARPIGTLKGHSDVVLCIRFVDSSLFAPEPTVFTASLDDTVRFWDISNPEAPSCSRLVRAPTGLTVAAPIPMRNSFACCTTQNVVKEFDSEMGSPIRSYEHKADPVAFYALSTSNAMYMAGETGWCGSGHLLAAAGDSSTVFLWDVRDPQPACTLFAPTDEKRSMFRSLQFSSTGHFLVGGSFENITLWDLRYGTILHSMKAHEDYVDTVHFSPNDTVIYSNSRDGSIRKWRSATGEALGALRSHDNPVVNDRVYSVNFAVSTDGRNILTPSDCGAVIGYDTTTGKEFFRHVQRSQREILRVSWNHKADSPVLYATADNVGDVQLWGGGESTVARGNTPARWSPGVW